MPEKGTIRNAGEVARLARDANSSPEKRDRQVSIAKRWGCGHFGNLVPSKYEKIKDVEGFGQTRLRGGHLSYGSHV
jgi:hypothetical protein